MHQEAKLLKDKSDTLRSEGERMTKEAEERLPKISLALPCVRYYDRCINLARTQADMEKEFGRGYFIDALAAVESQRSSAVLGLVRCPTFTIALFHSQCI